MLRKFLNNGVGFYLCLAVASFFVLGPSSVKADLHRKERVKLERPPKSAFSRLSIFKKNFNTNSIVSVVDLSDESDEQKKAQEESEKKRALEEFEREKSEKNKLRFVSENPNDDLILPPEETPSVRLNPSAPSSIKAMVKANRSGNRDEAKAYAGQFVRYQQNYFFEVQEMVNLIGEALVQQQVIDEEDWLGVGQMIDYEMAQTRYEVGAILKPTHEVAMKRIKADPNQKAEIFYFFTLDCSWCRYMAPDIERLWRLSKRDPKITMHVLAIGNSNAEWLSEYTEYNDWSMPVMDGSEVARKWKIGFVPAVVVVSPTNNKAYMKTGQQSFERLFDFVRTVQGLPSTVTKDFKMLASTPVGEAERKSSQLKIARTNKSSRRGRQVAMPPKRNAVEIQRF